MLHECSQFKAAVLQHFYFSSKDIMEWIEIYRPFLCLLQCVWNQSVDDIFQVLSASLEPWFPSSYGPGGPADAGRGRDLPNPIVAFFIKTHTE